MVQYLRLYNNLIQCHLIIFLFIASGHGQAKKETILVLGSIHNQTPRTEYDNFNIALNKILKEYPIFPETVLDTMLYVDSTPDESVIIKARGLDASYILWGVIDTSEYGFSVSIKIFDMFQAYTAHIEMMIHGNESKDNVAELLHSKLLMWLRSTTMVQLIITTTPASATILLDSKEIGVTPYEGMVQPGTFSLELIKRGFSAVRIPVSLISGNTYQYDFVLGNNSGGKIADKRSVIKLLTVSLLCAGTGGGAHFFQQRAMKEYRYAQPPADFNHLYRKAAAWNVGRNCLWAAAGASMCGILLKVILSPNVPIP